MTASGDTIAEEHPVRVFLSYAHADRARAGKLAVALEAAGFIVWWDTKIEGGAAFAASIRAALDAADAIVVLWSSGSIESDWVLDEAAYGRDRRRLVPLSMDGSEPPLGFRQYQAIDLSEWRGRADAPQIGSIERAIAVACERPARPARARVAAARVSRRAALALTCASVLGLAGAGGWLGWREGLFGARVPANSLAILPFKNLSGDPAQDYFSDGLTEEFRSALARNPGLTVIAGTSSAAAGSAGEDVAAIARKLSVAFVVDGAVRREGDAVRISANLTDGATGITRWSQTFDRRLADIFAVQTEIAGLIARQLAMEIATAAPAPGGTRVVAAYEAYLAGRALFNAARDEATDRAALAQYDLALAADPEFALAHAARSRSLAALGAEYASTDQLRALYDAAIAAAERAVAIAPDLAEAQLALGYATFIGRFDVPGARAPYDKAFALGHGDADILLLFALYSVRVRRGAEARSAITRALALDPLNPRTFRAAGSINYSLRRYDTAIDYLKHALVLNPTMSNARALIGNCLYQLGRFSEAKAAYLAETHDVFRLAGLAIVEHRLGDEAAAKQAMAALISVAGDAATYQQAEVRAQWGESAAAIATLRQARAVGDSGLLYIATDPLLDPLAREPGFTALMHALSLA